MEATSPWGLIDIALLSPARADRDAATAQVAGAQHGLITTAQLISLGLTHGSIAHRLARGRLHAVHRGVYMVGHAAISPVGRLAAAVLACGAHSILSHRSAAFLWELLPFDDGFVHLSVARGHPRGRKGIVVHRIGAVVSGDAQRQRGLPVTSPEMTILGLAETVGSRELDRAINEARAKQLVSARTFAALEQRTRGRRGWSRLNALFREEVHPDFDRSKAERILWRLIRRAQLPIPRRNVRIHGQELDFFWPDLNLNVETDGRATHAENPERFDADRARDADLLLHGIDVVRFTWGQLVNSPELVLARLAGTIAMARQPA